MDRLTSHRVGPSNATGRHSSEHGPPQEGTGRGVGEWQWEEDPAPPPGHARRRTRLPWPRAALIIGVLSLALWALIFVVIGMLFR